MLSVKDRRSQKGSRLHARFLGIVEGEAHDGCLEALLLQVELADLDRRPELRVDDVETGERNRLLQRRRASGAGDDADLCPADEDRVAVRRLLVALHLETDELLLRIEPAALDRGLAD